MFRSQLQETETDKDRQVKDRIEETPLPLLMILSDRFLRPDWLVIAARAVPAAIRMRSNQRMIAPDAPFRSQERESSSRLL